MKAVSSLETNKIYKFADLGLDTSQKVLMRENRPISLTPKAISILTLLVENSGRLLEKDELMREIWPDTVVEESNLTAHIKTLRKVLGDNAGDPKFIETVPRRGYRFIADVKVLTVDGDGHIGPVTVTDPEAVQIASRSLTFKRLAAVSAFLFIAAIGLAAVYIFGPSWSDAAESSTPSKFVAQQLTTNGETMYAVVSKDGKKAVYTNGTEGRQSVWLRDLETSNNVEIIPASADTYYGLAVSPDAKFIYFVRRPRSSSVRDIYRVSIFGGVPIRIIADTEGWISLSPDGQKISFVRCIYSEDEYCSLWTANAITGGDERKLITRRSPNRFGTNEFSPDGRSIAVAAGQSLDQSNDFGLIGVDIESGAERELSQERFFNIKGLAWLPNGDGLLVSASRVPNKYFRIWEVLVPSGAARLLTTDSSNYEQLSLNGSGDVLISQLWKQDFKLFVSGEKDGIGPTPLTDASQVAFAGNGRIFFSSMITGNDEIWSMKPDGSDRRQLTNDPADDISPTVAGGESVFFASNRSGRSQVWRMNTDGSDQTRLTETSGGLPVSVSSDGRWVYYRRALDETLWRVSADGGNEECVLNRRLGEFAVSPDGSLIAYMDRKDGSKVIRIVSLADGSAADEVKMEDRSPVNNKLSWTPDGSGVIYVQVLDGDLRTLWHWRSGQGRPEKIADLGSASVNSIAAGPDGKSFAVVKGRWSHDAVLIRGLR